jgi:hypothetical protein
MYARLVTTSPFNRTNLCFFYTAIYLKSLGYVLSGCFFEDKALLTIQNWALCAFLAKCGYNCNTQQTIVFAPIRYGGCGFISLYLIQGEGQILTFLKHWRSNTDAGNLLRIAVAWTQLHIDTSASFLMNTETPLPHLPGRWLKSLRSFLHRIDGSLELDLYFLPPPQRHRDVYIMDMVLASKSFSASKICRINYCHLFLYLISLYQMESSLIPS